ncbi:MAG: mechanosensitive ion channel [Sulfurovum sp.]|nr:mechanosensitive ion channel [Sulfurovum sp.]MCB4746183.1 mechanosensitive ion channel [Sulfurovum sp.]MCB4749019.1 mechanosensitive ion channel [Sulfurovum sp.]MCB4750434.1 mechanosensitive ion channel [Sulfurovum sp.]MCB4751916.1 mechanosensitive ion channel [Sulfurovum sp.]
MPKSFTLLLLLLSLLMAEQPTLQDIKIKGSPDKEKVIPKRSKFQNTTSVKGLLEKKNILEESLKENSTWSKIYSNYHTYKELKNQKIVLDKKINKFSLKRRLNASQQKTLNILENEKKILIGKLQLLKEYEDNPFKKFLRPPSIGEIPHVGNPFAIISAFSFMERLKNDQSEYYSRYHSIKQLMEKLEEKKGVLKSILEREPQNQKLQKEFTDIEEEINTFIPVIEIFKTTQNVYQKKIDEISLNLQKEIRKEIEKATIIGIIILIFLIVIFLVKYLVKRYMSDNDRFYTINKFLNFTFFSLLLLTLLFAYIENVNYLVTILGFASAGIAIALKDWFMSLIGWFVIIIGGAVHVGDRVKFVRSGMEYVGDIVDISLLRMTIQEDITLTTYMHNRRAGRIIFVPNNYIFTDMIANYSHAGLKTVWDGIDFMITFDSNVQKASSIAKEITKKYSKGYTDITRKQLNKLRSQYSMKNTNVEPRIYTFIEPYGIKISAWYHTNAYATLTLRSTISIEMIERIQAEEDINLAFPTQSIYLDKDVRKPPLPEPTLFNHEIDT